MEGLSSLTDLSGELHDLPEDLVRLAGKVQSLERTERGTFKLIPASLIPRVSCGSITAAQRRMVEATDSEIDTMVQEWRERRPGAEHGDGVGRPVAWPRRS